MSLRRVRVEEGFLDGLDIEFVEGLNVIVGPRGAGKTSLIELVRFALGVRGYTEESERTALEHARSVLGSGEVTVTVQIGKNLVDVSRSAEEPSPRALATYPKPIVLSQNEIESIGLAATGRLRLLDGFRSPTDQEPDVDLRASIKSLSVELQSLSGEISNIDEQLGKLEEVRKELAAAKKQQDSASASLKKLSAEQQQLQKITAETAAIGVRTDLLARTAKQLVDWRTRIEATMNAFPALERWPEQAGTTDLLKDARTLAAAALEHLGSALESVEGAQSQVQANLTNSNTAKVKLDQTSREVRKVLEHSQAGAGEIAKRVSTLQQQVSRLTALQSARSGRVKRRDELTQKRSELLDRLDVTRDQQHAERLAVAKRLNDRLGPRIRVDIEKSGTFTQYASAIGAALRGSGLHYNVLAPLLASRLSPRELVEAVESDDVGLLASVAEISTERAVKLAAYTRSQGLSEILTAPLDDLVTLKLLDGKDYKDSEELSTGQRCTVVLPILLAHDDRTVIVDQPEDHLDNAFIVETVIKAIQARRRGQIVFSTHNANIPVLGEASRVVVLGSDGRRGFVRHTGSLEDRMSVQAITTIMEGGREAFERRASFYGLPVRDPA